MAERAGAYFEEHKESGDLRRLALRGGTISVAMQYGNGVSRYGHLGTALGAGGFWIICDRHGSDELCTIVNRFWSRRRYSTKKQDNL